MQFETEEGPVLSRRWKVLAGVVIAVMVVVLVLEWTVLRGEQIARFDVGLGSSDTEKIIIDRVGEKHVLEVNTRRTRGGKTEGRAVKVRLVDPNGVVAYEDGEWVAKKKRYCTFTPTVAGSYEISIRPDGFMSGSSWGRAWVAVYVGDRRILPKLMAALPF